MIRRQFELPKRLTSKQYFNQMPDFCISFYEVNNVYPLHWHEFYEMEFIISGEGLHTLNGVEYHLQAGDLFLLTPADFHEVLPNKGTQIKLFNIKFPDEVITDELRALFSDTKDVLITQCSNESYNRMKQEFERLYEEYSSPNIGSGIVIRGGIGRVLVDLIRKSCNSVHSKTVDRKYTDLQLSLIYMHHHFREPISLADVAEKSHISPNYFSECFHKTVGVSFQSYLQSLRLDFARTLLAVSQLPVTEVCFACGFNSISHFIRAFKKTYNLSPNAFRKSN
jgi:AraC-like DNA-binding protein